LVSFSEGYKVRLIYFVKVLGNIEKPDPLDLYRKYCPEGETWRISLFLDKVPSVGIHLNRTGLNLEQSNMTVNFGNLSGPSLGQITGTIITLDDNAAGHGWFIDYTPYLNEEFLPTANPNEWVARPGSEAEGKMDLLSVLWHEYGHALGLEHSKDAHDFMGATLAPGARRTLTAEETTALR
jgi:hypothetical protein